VKLTIPAVPPSLNKTQRMHWAKRKRMNDSWKLWVRGALPELYLKPFVKMRCTVWLFHSRPYDKDNSFGAVKPVVDALRHWKLIYDDTAEYLDLDVQQEKCKRKEGHTEIYLEAAP